MRGLLAQGGFEVDVEWAGGVLVVARISPRSALAAQTRMEPVLRTCTVRYGDQTLDFPAAVGTTYEVRVVGDALSVSSVSSR